MNNNQTVEVLTKEKFYLQQIIQAAEEEVNKAPAGGVVIRKHKKGVQFYHLMDPKKKNGTYIPVSDRGRAHNLIRKGYLAKLAKEARIQLKIVEGFLARYRPDALTAVFEKEAPMRRAFLRPLVLPDAMYAETWQAEEYERKEFHEGTTVHYTQRNERVRSKSEAMIADALDRAGIPYRYECPLHLKNSLLIHPDFTILRMSDRKELYWEHLGMMDDMEYRNNAFQRIRDYEANGIFPGVQLIITIETYKMPLNKMVIERMIRAYL